MFIIFVFLVLYYLYGWSFAKGAAIYARDNNDGSANAEDSWQIIYDELDELKYAIKSGSISGIFLEFFDVLHATIKLFIITFLPKSFYFHPICWLLVFPFVMPIGIKLGYRYNKYRCIRNHSRINKNHKCILNQFSKK